MILLNLMLTAIVLFLIVCVVVICLCLWSAYEERQWRRHAQPGEACRFYEHDGTDDIKLTLGTIERRTHDQFCIRLARSGGCDAYVWRNINQVYPEL